MDISFSLHDTNFDQDHRKRRADYLFNVLDPIWLHIGDDNRTALRQDEAPSTYSVGPERNTLGYCDLRGVDACW